MNIELRHLRYFVAVADEASFTAAAQRVHVAQQVLSAQIRQLEDAVGTQLLNRTNKGATLTPAGAAFLTVAQETLASLDRGVAAARNAARAVSGKLSVGIGSGCENETRTQLLTAFERAYPDVEIHLQDFNMTQPSAGLLDHSSDVALLRPPSRHPGSSWRWCGRSRASSCCRRGTRSRQAKSSRWPTSPGCRLSPPTWQPTAASRGPGRMPGSSGPGPAATCRSSVPPPEPSTFGASMLQPGTASACALLRRPRSTAVPVSASSRAPD